VRDVAAWMLKNATLSAEGLPPRRRCEGGGRRHDCRATSGTAPAYCLTQLPSFRRPHLPQRRHLRHLGQAIAPAPSIPTGRSSTSPATRRSASPAWRWRGSRSNSAGTAEASAAPKALLAERPLSAGGFHVKAAKEETSDCLDIDSYGSKLCAIEPTGGRAILVR
jgi:hypothetical protein